MSLRRRRIVGIGIAAALALALGSGARCARADGGQTLSTAVGLGIAYDSNLLHYSDDQRTLFEAGTRPERFSIHSLDDLTWNPSLALTWELNRGGGRSHALRLKGEGDFHQQNGTADWRAAGVSWRESFRRGRRLALGWYQLPRYYLRQLSDEDFTPPFPGLSNYRRAQFDLGIGSASWLQQVRAATLELDYQFERRRYLGPFRDRDSDTHQGEAQLGFTRLPHRSRIVLSGGWRAAKARASDGDEIAGAPDDPDVSYSGFVGGVAGRTELGRRGDWRLAGDLAWEIGTRSYSSDRPADRYHLGRNDVFNALEAGLRVRWRRHWGARGFYRYERNDAHLGSTAPATAEVGSYHEHLTGLALEWAGTLWRSGARGEGEPEE